MKREKRQLPLGVLIGCCGFAAARSRYFRSLPAVEVQQTFYQPPQVATLKRWRAEASEGFTFTVKAWQLITHEASSPTYRRLRLRLGEREKARCGSFRPTEEVERGWQATREACDVLQAPVVLFQTPARFDPSEEHLRNLRRFFRHIDRQGRRMVFEPRGAAWNRELVARLCKELDLVHGVDPFVTTPPRAGWCYYRLHGIGGYRHRFTGPELDRLVGFLRSEQRGYVFFNNLSMWEDALELKRRLGRCR